MNGLTTKAARERLKQDGENELAAAAKLHPLRMFLGQFRDVMVLILLAATGVSAFLGEITDAVTIILIVLLNAILGFLQEYRTEQTLESLRSLTAPTATVCRDGKWLENHRTGKIRTISQKPGCIIGTQPGFFVCYRVQMLMRFPQAAGFPDAPGTASIPRHHCRKGRRLHHSLHSWLPVHSAKRSRLRHGSAVPHL